MWLPSFPATHFLSAVFGEKNYGGMCNIETVKSFKMFLKRHNTHLGNQQATDEMAAWDLGKEINERGYSVVCLFRWK